MTRQKRRFTVAGFEGPLDLLWYLIKQNEINIFDIPIALITQQYMEYLNYAKEDVKDNTIALDDLSEFYKWAALLLKVKSQMLLPVAIVDNGDEGSDPRHTLVEKLIEYQRFKKLASLIEMQEDTKLWGFNGDQITRRVFYDEETPPPKIDAASDIIKLQKIYGTIMRRISNKAVLETYEKITVNEKVTLLIEMLCDNNDITLECLITRKNNKMDIICAFMAALEQVKTQRVTLYQEKLFDTIYIHKKM